jgi:hypothetical protein
MPCVHALMGVCDILRDAVACASGRLTFAFMRYDTGIRVKPPQYFILSELSGLSYAQLSAYVSGRVPREVSMVQPVLETTVHPAMEVDPPSSLAAGKDAAILQVELRLDSVHPAAMTAHRVWMEGGAVHRVQALPTAARL